MKNLRLLVSLVLCMSMASVQAMQPAVDAAAQPAQEQVQQQAPAQQAAAAQAGFVNKMQNFLVSPQFGIGLTVVLGLVGALIVLKKTLFADDSAASSADQRAATLEAADLYAEKLDMLGDIVNKTPTTTQEVFNTAAGNPRAAAHQRLIAKTKAVVSRISGKRGRA